MFNEIKDEISSVNLNQKEKSPSDPPKLPLSKALKNSKAKHAKNAKHGKSGTKSRKVKISDWIKKASRARTMEEYKQIKPNFDRLKKAFSSKYPKKHIKKPKFHHFYKNQFVQKCQEGWKEGFRKGKAQARRFHRI